MIVHENYNIHMGMRPKFFLVCISFLFLFFPQNIFAATIIFQDFFTGSSGTLLENHTPDIGTSWVEIIDNGRDIRLGPHPTNNIEVTSNGTDVGTLYQANATYTTADYDVSADVLWSGGDSNYTRTLAARIQDANNMYTLVYGANIFQLWKRTSGTWTMLAAGSSYPSGNTSASPYIGDNVRLRVQGNVISGFINNTEVVSSTDSDHTNAGAAGVGFGYVNDSSDDSGTGVDTDSFLVQTIDNTPQVNTLFPADNATAVSSSANLVIQFDRIVTVATGTINIYTVSDGSLFESIFVTSSQVTGSGSQTIIINPNSTFVSEASYYVHVPSTAFIDTSSSAYVGINDATTWNFTIADEVNPDIQSLSPADNATGVSTSTNLVVTFDETIVTSTGNLYIRRASDDQIIETFSVASSTVTASGTTALVLNPTSNLQESTSYYITIDATAIDDDSGNSFAGIASASLWNFTTADNTNPIAQTVSPADDSLDVSVSANFVITFNESIVVSSGNVVVYNATDGSVVETISITSGNVTGSGTSQLTINPSNNLLYSTSYYVQIDATAIDDTSGNSYSGITDSVTWNISTQSVPAAEELGGGPSAFFMVFPSSKEFVNEAVTDEVNGIAPWIDVEGVLHSNADLEVVTMMAYAIDNPTFAGVSMIAYQDQLRLEGVTPGETVFVRYMSYTGGVSKDFSITVPSLHINSVHSKQENKPEVITNEESLRSETKPIFARDLFLGMRGEDVKQLQRVLNEYGFFVNTEGFGSRGNETIYFGLLTYNAVKKFQQTYAQDILIPLDLNQPTGYVGSRTIAVLKDMY